MRQTACSLQLLHVVADDGRKLGRVFDLQCHWQPGAETSAIETVVYGRLGWMERMGFVVRKPETLPWSAVRELRGRTLVVAADAVPAGRKPR